jgi:signal transduction histidine kinase
VTEHETLGVRPDSTAMVRALGLLYLVGPSVAAVTLLLPRSPNLDATPIWFAIAGVYALAPVIFFYYRRLPDWAISGTIAFTNAAVTTGVYFNHEATSFYAFFYLWVTPYAAAFFSGRHALGHVTFVGALYGVMLAAAAHGGHGAPGHAEISQWLQTMCALLVTMLLVRSLSGALRENLARSDEERRRRAVEINDDVVQRLVIARHAYEAGDDGDGDLAVEAALGRARVIMAELIGTDRILPGSLRRDRAAT